MLFIGYFAYANRKIIKLARQGASMLGLKAGEARRKRVVTREGNEAKAQIMQNVRAKIPFNLSKGVSDEGLFALLQDKDFITGITVVANTVGGLTGALVDKVREVDIKNPLKKKEENLW